MVDYWVSRERHYCKYCNVWMQSDKLSVKHHEQGRKHKEKVEETLKLKRQTKSDATKMQKELRDQLQQIEDAAQVKFEQDMADRSRKAPPPPPRRFGQRNAPLPPPKRHEQSSTEARSHQQNRQSTLVAPFVVRNSSFAEQVEEEEEEEEGNGVYAVRGVVYLEGKKHETQLETGSACQIWVEEAERWLDALVEKATVHTVPNTDLSFRRFTMTYKLPLSEEGIKNGDKSEPVTEREVSADRLRIPLPSNVTLEDAEKMVDQWRNGGTVQVATRARVAIDETTGMGEWKVVEVREIDESSEAVGENVEEAEAAVKQQKRLDALEDFSSQGDNALGAFNPWGGSYKGVKLDDAGDPAADCSLSSAVASREEEINITTSGNVSFKKRGQKKHKRRRIHTDDE